MADIAMIMTFLLTTMSVLTTAGCLGADDSIPRFLAWDTSAKERLPDGRVRQEFVLRVGPFFGENEDNAASAVAFEKVEVIGLVQPPYGISHGQDEAWRAVLDPDAPRVTLESGSAARVTLLAEAILDGTVYYAQTTAILVGSGGGGLTGPGEPSAPAPWPLFSLTGPSSYPRAGQEVLVGLEGPFWDSVPSNPERSPGASGAHEIWAMQWENVAPIRLYGPVCRFFLDLDSQLAERGYSAAKNVYFFVRLPGGGSASLTETVYRSDTAGRSMSAGTAIVAVFLLLGHLTGRRIGVLR
ncbi:MAG: hypothetical protein LBP92_06545 [Deltaproteobacteria bacterium]|jgi:hypothetical protein|nr:hypothetical protein [Deltaproteobacteria bacterium]